MDEAVGLSTGMRIFPLDGRTLGVVGGEHFRCYVSRTTTGVVNIEGVEELDQSSFLKGRQTQGGREKVDALAAKAAGETQRDIEPELEHAIAR